MPDLVRISATAAGISYYPEHVARTLGYFRDEDLVVRTEAPGHGPWVTRALLADQAELALGGIWRPLMYRGRLDTFTPFAQLCLRCPAVVLARRPMPDFAWSDMIGQRVIVPDGAPTPLIAVLAVLRWNDIDPNAIKLIQHFVSEEARDLFTSGLGDFYVASPPTSDLLVASGAAFEVAELATTGGNLPWSVYYSLPDYLERPGNVPGRFCRALQRALDWVARHDPAEAPDVFRENYPKLDPALGIQAARKCKALGLWPASVRMDPADLARWQQVLVDSDLIDAPFPFADAFDVRPADWALANPIGG